MSQNNTFRIVSAKDAKPFTAKGLSGPKQFLEALIRTQEAGGKVSSKVNLTDATGEFSVTVTFKAAVDATDPAAVEKLFRTVRGTVGKAAEFIAAENLPGIQPGGEILPSDFVRWIGLEEPKAEEPKAEEPKAEEPKAEEPKAEEPKAEEPKAEEPTAPTQADRDASAAATEAWARENAQHNAHAANRLAEIESRKATGKNGKAKANA